MTADLVEGVKEIHQVERRVHARWAVEGDDRVRMLGVKFEAAEDRRLLPARAEGLQSVDHEVADEVNLLWRDAFSEQVLPSALLRHEEEVGDGIREQAVDLLRHGAVEASQPGLHVSHRNPKLYGGDGGSRRGVHVAHHEHQIRTDRIQDRFESSHHFGGLNRMRAGADTETEVEWLDIQVPEELLRHASIVMLAGVDEDRDDLGVALHLPDQGGELDEIGPGPDDVDDSHGPTSPAGRRRRSIHSLTLDERRRWVR